MLYIYIYPHTRHATCTTAPKEHSVALSAADHWSEPHSEDSSVDCIPGKAEINKQVSCEDFVDDTCMHTRACADSELILKAFQMQLSKAKTLAMPRC